MQDKIMRRMFLKTCLVQILIIIFLTIPFVVLGKICHGDEIPEDALCLNLSYPELGPEGGKFDLNENQDINEIVAWLYYFIISISGFAAFTMLVRGGFMWLSSAGNSGTLKEAKDIISSAIFGLMIILASFLILQVINPELTTLTIEPLQSIQK